MLTKEEICRGCSVKHACSTFKYKNIERVRLCPCIECMVKVMCSHACDEWVEYCDHRKETNKNEEMDQKEEPQHTQRL